METDGEQIKGNKQGLTPVLVMLVLAATGSCSILTTSKNKTMGQVLQIDSTLIMDKFNAGLFNERDSWEYAAPDGTRVRVDIDGNLPYWQYAIVLIPAYDYYELEQLYDERGNIRERGRYSWESARGLGGGTKFGDWEYYDENGVKTVVNEDSYGKFTYEDVIRKLEARGILNRRTGKNRKDLDIYFHPIERYWHIFIVNDAGTPRGKCREIHIDKDTGRFLEDKTGPFQLIY